MFLSNPAMPEQTPGASFLLKNMKNESHRDKHAF